MTSANASDLSFIYGVTGNVSFDEYTNTLTLDNATITVNDNINNIVNKNNALTINVVGTNTLNGWYNIESETSLNITGTGTLDCTANGSGISCYFGHNVSTITPMTLTIQGGVNAIFKGRDGLAGHSRGTCKLVVNGANTRVTANGSRTSVCYVDATLNDGLRITQPVGAYFGNAGIVNDANGNTVSGQDVVICNPDCGPYAVYNAATTTLTFAYGNKPDGAYDLNTGTIQPAWFNDGTYANVTKVVFDPSFAEVRPTTTYYWFRNMSKLTNITGLNYLNTSEVTFMNSMFSGCSALTSLDLSSFNTAQVTSMTYMFLGCSNLESLDISGFNTGNVTTMLGMFANCKKLASLDLSNFNTANVTNMYAMFINCNKLATLDLMSFNTSKVTDTELMFGGCSSLTTIYVDDSWTTAAVTASNNMFQACTKLVGGAGTTYNANYLDKTYARLDGGPNSATPGYLSTKPQGYAVYDASTTTLTFRYGSKPEGAYSLNTGTNLPAWYRDGTCTNVTKVVFDPSFAEARPKTTFLWFSEMTQLTNISGFNYLNTSEVTSMRGMFYVCASITTLDLSSFNTAKVTDMLSMFENCHSLVTIKVSNNWSTSAVTSSNYMFRGCNSIKGQAGTTYDANHVDKAYAHVDGGTSNPGYLTHISRIYHEGLWYVVENSSSHGLRLLAPQFGSTYSGDVVIPESFKIGSTTWNVTCIDEEAFTGTAVTSVFVPGNVDHIYSRAFYGATQLSKLVIGYMYSPSYLYFGDDWVGNNASNLTCYVRNRFINSYENLFSGMNFSPWVLISESYYTDLHPYRAFSCKYKVTLPEGLEAYYVKDFNSATRTAVTQKFTGVLPANTGFLLKGSESKIYLLEKSTATPATVTGNLLVAYKSGDASPWTIQDDNSRFYFDDYSMEWLSTTNLFNYCSFLCIPKSQLGDDLTSPIHLDLEYTPELLVGDANEDGAVNVNDITTIINYILGKNPAPFNFNNANVNGDNKVDVLDITALINIILGIN